MNNHRPSHIAIASCTRYATEAGRRIFEAGGNAFDAAVATAFNLMVSHPLMCSIGGGGVATVKRSGEDPITISFFNRMPGKGAPPERFGQNILKMHLPHGPGIEVLAGHASISVPGTVKGLETLTTRYGNLTFREILEPAIRDARQGVPLNNNISNWMRTSCESLHWLTPYSKQLLCTEDGQVPYEGYLLKNPDLGDTLELIARDGSNAVYEGDLARRIVNTVQEGGGLLTMQDLQTYQVLEQSPLVTTSGEYRVYTAAPPSIGGCSLIQMLKVYPQLGLTEQSPSYYSQLARLIQHSLASRFDIFENSLDNLGEMARSVEDDYIREHYKPLLSSPNTTQVSTVDSDGNACSITLSMGYGSGVAIDGTGIFMDNMLGEIELNPFGLHAFQPGSCLITGMSPTIAMDESTGTLLALGTPGASRIATALFQVLLNITRFRMDLAEAISAPRIHWEDGVVLFEPGIEPARSELPGQWEIKPFDHPHFYFGGVQAARLGPGTQFSAFSDPRRSGYSLLAG